MQVASLDLYDLLKGKIGEAEARSLVTFIEQEAEAKFEQKKEGFPNKQDIHNLNLKIEKVNAELLVIMWMSGVVLAGIISLILKSFF